MPQFSESKIKGDLRAGFTNLCDQLRSQENVPSVWGIFWIFDGGNGLFYLYASRSSGEPTYDWKDVLKNDIAVRFVLSQELGTRAAMEDGTILKVEESDRALNDLLSKWAVKVMQEESTRKFMEGICHPKGCVAYLADDEVQGHKNYVTHNITP